MRGQTNASNIGGTIGSDTKPIKIVNGVAVPVANEFARKPISLAISQISGNVYTTNAWTRFPLSNATITGDITEFTFTSYDTIRFNRSGVAIITYHLAGTTDTAANIYTRIKPPGAQTIEQNPSISHSHDISAILPVTAGYEIGLRYYMSGASVFTVLPYNFGLFASITLI